jgi:hypothetical protein
MDNQDTSASVYSEAKSEYTKQLVFNFQPVLLRFFLDRYDEVKKSPSVMSRTKSALSEFQDSLSQIPEWNLDKVQKETTQLLQAVQCDYVDDLITAVFIAHAKILSAIKLDTKSRRSTPIQITIPKPDHFMHRAMSECSRIMWSNVYLFNDSASSLDRQKNMTVVNQYLEDGILQAIRNLLPVKSILRDSLRDEPDDAVQIASSVPHGEKAEEKVEEKTEEKAEEKPEEKPEEMVEEKPIIKMVPPEEVQVEKTPLQKAIKDEGLSYNTTNSNSNPNSNTLVVDTEKSVGFTGMDSLFGEAGEAELRPMIEEGDNDLKILGESEDLDLDEMEDINAIDEIPTPAPLSADDYETL